MNDAIMRVHTQLLKVPRRQVLTDAMRGDHTHRPLVIENTSAVAPLGGWEKALSAQRGVV